jgi:hypothetical protein
MRWLLPSDYQSNSREKTVDKFFIGEESGQQYRLIEPGEVIQYSGKDIPTHGLIATDLRYDVTPKEYLDRGIKSFTFRLPVPPMPKILPGDMVVSHNRARNYILKSDDVKDLIDVMELFRGGERIWKNW